MSLAQHGNASVAGLFINNRGEPVGQSTSSGTSGSSRATKIVTGLRIALLVAGLILATAPAGLAAPARFELVGTHPQAAAQSTTLGRTISTLKIYRGQIYAGYGDQNVNTGPIAITPFDPATNTFAASPSHIADTEALQIYREINGRLFAPSTDSKTGNDFAVSSISSEAETWETRAGLGSTHIYDVVSLDGNDLWMVGSQNRNAAVWRSVDGGASWQQSLTIAPRNDWDFARFYFAGVLDGRLYVQAQDGGVGAHPTSMVFTQGSWSPGTPVLPSAGDPWGHHTEKFAGKLIFQSHPAGWADLFAFDGSSTTKLLTTQIRDFVIADSKIFVLTMENNILSSTNLVDWATVVSAPRGSTSLTATSGDIFVGTANAELYRYTITTASTSTKGPRCRPKRCTSTTTTQT